MNIDISPPDPSWDYYIHYHKLLRAKSKIEELTQWLAEFDMATDESDASLDDDLLAIIKVLEDTRNYEARSPDEAT
jgi:hypothetical protein